MAAMAVVAAIQAVGAIQQGQATSDSLNKQADINIANAGAAEAQGKADAYKSQLIAGQKFGQISAGFGASGVTSTSGSVEAVLGASAANAEMDRLNILHGADLKAIQYQNQASMERAGASSAIVGSLFGAAGAATKTAVTAYGGTSAATTSGPQSTMSNTSTSSYLGMNYNYNESTGP